MRRTREVGDEKAAEEAAKIEQEQKKTLAKKLQIGTIVRSHNNLGTLVEIKKWVIPPSNIRLNLMIAELLSDHDEMNDKLDQLVGPQINVGGWKIRIVKVLGLLSAILTSGLIGSWL